MRKIARVAQAMELSEEAMKLVSEQVTAERMVQELWKAGLVQDGLKLLAGVLPARYAVAWVCECARGETLAVRDRAGAALAEKWLRAPSEEHRRAAYEFARADGFRSLGGWIAASAGWSSGSLAPPAQEQSVPPPEHLSALAVVAAINLLAGLVADRFDARRRQFGERALPLLGPQG